MSNGTGVAGNDLRGKHNSRPQKYPYAIKNILMAHIKLFPAMESHYVRAESSKQYLPEGLSMKKMRRMLTKEIKAAKFSDIEISRHLYTKIFNENFNYGFFKPKKDK